ncbi:hypothetical protein C5167_001937 [Papaver somniferum]|uniref:Uncharacterized protein n=1 Tax=Papaver somniferum TaxID=3469 RepID=A0A4Y7KZF5_PAPSO|nr:hypothetical protein C5167_001937 [Papaver somniferum]
MRCVPRMKALRDANWLPTELREERKDGTGCISDILDAAKMVCEKSKQKHNGGSQDQMLTKCNEFSKQLFHTCLAVLGMIRSTEIYQLNKRLEYNVEKSLGNLVETSITTMIGKTMSVWYHASAIVTWVPIFLSCDLNGIRENCLLNGFSPRHARQ